MQIQNNWIYVCIEQSTLCRVTMKDALSVEVEDKRTQNVDAKKNEWLRNVGTIKVAEMADL